MEEERKHRWKEGGVEGGVKRMVLAISPKARGTGNLSVGLRGGERGNTRRNKLSEKGIKEGTYVFDPRGRKEI